MSTTAAPEITCVRFWVPGVPAPGGSKRAFVRNGKAHLVDDAKRNKEWRATVAQVASEHASQTLQGPLRMTLTFVFTRPAGHFGKTGLRRSAPKHPTVRPDLTKLVRSTEDAMLGIVYGDDSQIVTQVALKLYGGQAGCEVVVSRVTD